MNMKVNNNTNMTNADLEKQKRGHMTLLIITVSLLLFGSGVTLGRYIG